MSGKLKNLLITGDSSGIGEYIKNNLSKKLNIVGVSRTGNDINCDLSNIKNISKIIDYLEKNNIILDYIILNAGIGYFGNFNDLNIKKYEEIINLNLLSPIILLRSLEKYLNKKAKIIFIGSIISKKFMKGASVYQASKFGLRGFAGGLKNELKGQKVHIINPSIVNTNFHKNSEIIIKDSYRRNELNDILEVVKSIIKGDEKRFEIDL